MHKNQWFDRNDKFRIVDGQGAVNEKDEEEEDEIDVDDWFSYICWVFILLFHFLIFVFC